MKNHLNLCDSRRFFSDNHTSEIMSPTEISDDSFHFLITYICVCGQVAMESFQQLLSNVTSPSPGIMEEGRLDIFAGPTLDYPHPGITAGFFPGFLIALDSCFIHVEDFSIPEVSRESCCRSEPAIPRCSG